jgi:2-polyprenyl-3-methyl-5-hydroxy-6-metoxy-1,4-benzoquinol methylase
VTPGVLVGILAAGIWNFATNSNLTWRAWWNRKILARPAEESAAASARATPLAPGTELVPCNLCGSPRYAILYRGRSARTRELDPKSMSCTSDRHGEFTNIVECSDCGLIYQNPRDNPATLAKLYAGVDDPVYEREREGRVRTFGRLVERLGRFTRPGRLLDVGCYTGIFLEQARRAAWEACGVEPSVWAAARARQKGFTVYEGAFRDARELPAPFDAVTIWDVIEHLPDPLADLRHACAILKPGGVLGLSTMDASSLFARLAGRRWPWYMRMHLVYFTRESMRRMLEAAGFEILAIERHERIVSLRYFLEKAASNVPGFAAIGRKFAAPFGNVYSVFQLGDIMNVFGRRPM